MTSAWFLLFVGLAAASRAKFVTTEEPDLTDATTPGYSQKLVEDYDDAEDYQYYDDEEEDLQADYTPKKFDRYRQKLEDSNDAKQHYTRVKTSYLCRVPQPKVVRVLEHHPSASKTYVPSCTVLHHCSETTGCCPANQRCGPKKTEKLELPFYVVHDVPGPNPHYPRRVVKTENLVFFNHTECACHVRGDEMPRDVTPTPYPPAASLSDCRCPAPFNPRVDSGRCSCDCFDKQRDCIKYKRGRDYLNHDDRLCIEMRKCKPPSCDYGVYVRRTGRCPRKDEKP